MRKIQLKLAASVLPLPCKFLQLLSQRDVIVYVGFHLITTDHNYQKP